MSVSVLVRPLPVVAWTLPGGTAAGAPEFTDNDWLGLFWRSSVGGTSIFQADLGADSAFDVVALLAIFGPAAAAGNAQIKVATAAQGGAMSGGAGGGANQYWQSGTFDLFAGANGLVTGRQAMFWQKSDSANAATFPAAARYVRIEVSGLGANYLQFSRLVVGAQLTIRHNFSFGAAFGVRPFGAVEYSARGVLLRRKGVKMRMVGLTYSNIYKDEVEAQVQPLVEAVGTDAPILLVTDPDAHVMRTRRIFFGHLEGDLGTIWRNAKCWEWRANLASLF